METSSTYVWLLPLLVLILAILSVPASILDDEGMMRFERLREESRHIESNNEELAREIHQLRIEVEELRADPTTIERVAREKHSLVGKNDIVIQF